MHEFSFGFRYNKQLIAQIIGRHENLFNPENSFLPTSSLGRIEFSGLTNLRVSLQTGQ